MGFGHCYSHDRDLTSIFVATTNVIVATRVCGVLGGVLVGVWMDAPRGVRSWLCARILTRIPIRAGGVLGGGW